MRRIAIALATFVVLGLALDAAAVLDTSAFRPLRNEFDERLANDYGGELNRALRKEQKAITKSLALLDKESLTLVQDAATGKKITKLLQKSFKAEFAATQAGKSADLPPLLEATANALGDTVRSRISSSIELVPSVRENKQRKVEKQLDKANAALEAAAAATSQTKRFAKIGSAAKASFKARKLIAKFGDGTGPGTAGMSADVNGGPYSAEFAQAEFQTGDSTLEIFGTRTDDDGAVESITVSVRGITGPGSYALTVENATAEYRRGSLIGPAAIYTLSPGSGVLDVDVLDFDAPRVRVTFSFDAENPTLGIVTITNGVLDVTENVFVQ